MVAFVAKDESVVVAALRAGLIPDAMAIAPVVVSRSGAALCLEPTTKVKRDVQTKLKTAGFEVLRKHPKGVTTSQVGSWPEVISCHRAAEPTPPLPRVLFVCPKQGFLTLVGDLVRLGCDNQELSFFSAANGDEYCVCRAIEPPYYVVLSALDPASTVTAYSPVDHRGAVWLQLGFEHPLAREVSVPQTELLLVGEHAPWLRVPDGPWTPLYEKLDIALPDAAEHVTTDFEEKLQVTLRLTRSSRTADASLWVLRKDAAGQLDRLLTSLPERVLSTLAFAQFDAPEGRMIVLRARRVGDRPPILELANAESYTPLAQIQNLYLPIGTSIAPPLRFERLKQLFAPDPAQLVWAVPLDKDAFRLERVDESAFVPLTDWVEHVAAEDFDALTPWLQNTVFEFEKFTSIGVEWDAPPPQAIAKPEPPRRREQREQPEPAQVVDVIEDEPSGPVELPALDLPEIALNPSEASLELERLEREFCELDVRANAPERVRMWLELAVCYTAAKRVKDAGLAWTHTLWEIDDQRRLAQVAKRWAEAEAKLSGHNPSRLPDAPTARQVRTVAAHVVAAWHDNASLDVGAIHSWIGEHGALLDTRSFWLVREALADLTGGDQLARVQAQDAVLQRLKGGLSSGDEVPAFIRTWGDDDGPQGHALEFLAEHLEQVRVTYTKTKRKRSAIECEPKITDGYVEFLFAWGFARLGRTDEAKAAIVRANKLHSTTKMDATDPVHAFLRTTFQLRVGQALDGMPVETPLPTELMTELEGLERYIRYKVDRLREASTILDWTHDLDPFASFGMGQTVDVYADIGDASVGVIVETVDAILSSPGSSDDYRRAVALLQVLPEFHAVPRVQTLLDSVGTLTADEQVPILEDAMLVAARCESGELVRAIAAAFSELLEAASADDVVAPALALSRLSSCLHRARQSEAVLAVLQKQLAAIDSDTPEMLLACLQIAAAMAELGDDSQVEHTTAAALTIPDADLTPKLRLQLIRQITQTLSHTSPGQAVTGVDGLLKSLTTITDSFNTNSHFCLSVLHFMESMVLGLARADLSLSPAAQQFIEEDEHRIRRRIFAAAKKGHNNE